MTEMKRLDENAKKSWCVSRLIAFVIFAIAIVTGWFFLKDEIGKYIWIYYLTGGLILLFRLISALVYPTIEYKQWAYSIDEDKVQIVHGIYFITTSIVPILRIQHIEVQQGPLNRMFSLANIIIKTAGGSISIPGLHKDEAAILAEYINVRTVTKVKEQLNHIAKESGVNHE